MRTSVACSPQTGSTSSSTNKQTLAAEMVGAVVELANVKPHISDDARFTTVTWPSYCEGYYAALCAAVRVMKLAIDRRRTRERLKRAARIKAAAEAIPATAARARLIASVPHPQPVKVHVFPNKNAAFYRPIRPLRHRRG